MTGNFRDSTSIYLQIAEMLENDILRGVLEEEGQALSLIHISQNLRWISRRMSPKGKRRPRRKRKNKPQAFWLLHSAQKTGGPAWQGRPFFF